MKGDMELQNPSKKNHIIKATLEIEVNYGDAEANAEYSDDLIKETLEELLRCEMCGEVHLGYMCGMDTVTIKVEGHDKEVL